MDFDKRLGQTLGNFSNVAKMVSVKLKDNKNFTQIVGDGSLKEQKAFLQKGKEKSEQRKKAILMQMEKMILETLGEAALSLNSIKDMDLQAIQTTVTSNKSVSKNSPKAMKKQSPIHDKILGI